MQMPAENRPVGDPRSDMINLLNDIIRNVEETVPAIVERKEAEIRRDIMEIQRDIGALSSSLQHEAVLHLEILRNKSAELWAVCNAAFPEESDVQMQRWAVSLAAQNFINLLEKG
jgi:hypothetical protein